MGRDDSAQFGTALTFLLIGLSAGAVAALLLAPKSGVALRKDIRKRYDDARDAIEDLADEAKGRVEDALERGSEWMDDVEETTRKRVAPLARALRRS